MKVNRKKGFFSISAVAKMFSIHQQTIRLYEKQGLISPQRSAGNTRLFSEEDIDRLEEVIYLTHELGINLAGVEMILKLKKQMRKMQKEMNNVFEQTQKDLDKQVAESHEVMRASSQKLKQMKQIPVQQPENLQESAPVTTPLMVEANWEVEYED
jgi:MerR family transcriptional regulator/heat shock protein HspR